MSILYTLIAKSKTIILASFTECQGNFQQLTLKILEKVVQNKRATYSYDKHFFHYVENDNLVVMCMTEQSFARPAAFVFLDDVRETFLRMFSQNDIQRAIAHSLQKSYEKVLKEKMQHYNSSKDEIDKVALLEKNVRSYSEEIIQANELIEQRAGKIGLMVQKAENLRTESKNYYTKSKKVKSTVKCNKAILISFIIVVVILVVYIAVSIGCGFDFSKC